MKFILGLLIASSAFATPSSVEVQKQIATYTQVLEANDYAGASWDLELIRIRTVLEFGIKIPVIAEFSINPEIELFFSKK